MKIVFAVARYLLGLVFAVFGANMLFPFLPNPPLPPGPIKDFTTVLALTHYILVVGFFQLAGGILLLVNRYVPLALTMLAAELVNILTTHLFVMHSGLFPVPTLVVLCWILVFYQHRAAFTPLFRPKA
jgi:putative oxidoreductase